jgi:hypothetical protein
VNNQTVIWIVMGGVMAWSIYRRVRRSIGKQKLKPKRTIARLVIFCVVSFLILLSGFQAPRVLLGFGGGLLAGALLGFLGLRLTQFETTEEGHFYKPDTRIGVGLSLLLTGRVIYRMVVLNNVALAPNHPPPMQSPLTYLIIGLTFGYYIVYYIGLFVHTHDKKPAAQTNISP